MSVEVQRPKDVANIPALDDILNSKIKHRVEDDPMLVWDKGVFINELHRQGIAVDSGSSSANGVKLDATSGLQKGSYKGTQLALTEMYSMAEEMHVSHFDSAGFEPIFPQKRDIEKKNQVYQWSNDKYPPHLEMIPKDQDLDPTVLFNPGMLGFVGAIGRAFQFLIPTDIEHKGTPYEGPTLTDCENYNRAHPSAKTDIMDGKNIGDLEDWYSDARFAHQHFSGVNPSTIETATSEKVKAYTEEAGKQGLEAMKKLLSEGKDLLMQDYSYFREATGVSKDHEFINQIREVKDGKPTANVSYRYACASVVIFQLHEDGRLHPLAITLDYKSSLDDSVTIFNRRLTPDDKGDIPEKDDWPWRYAKTCAQTADWARHEIASHLVDTHMIEEAIIVATNRTIPENHLLYEILNPHWFRTLALNAAARKILVPLVIARVAGFGPDPVNSLAYPFVDWSYKHFNFQDKYIPNDLKKRGFDLDVTGDKYRNYPYAYCMSYLWSIIRNFAQSVIATTYKSDKDIQDDTYIADWCKEIQIQGKIPTFPTITTVDQLVDAVTMCIHTASPQHTAVNYLQDYYYSFVPSKPAALCTKLPADLKTLQAYTEKDLTAALPIGTDGQKWKDWLLSAQLPELLSFKVEDRYNLITYAKSLYNVNKNRTVGEKQRFDFVAVKEAAARFYSQLKDCELAFDYISACQTEGSIDYKVLQPQLTAVSILI